MVRSKTGGYFKLMPMWAYELYKAVFEKFHSEMVRKSLIKLRIMNKKKRSFHICVFGSDLEVGKFLSYYYVYFALCFQQT